MFWKIRDRQLPLKRTLLMGILNVTPDSFSDGGLYANPDEAVRHAGHLIEEGADILDLGAESTRPGAPPVSEHEEINRLEPVLSGIKKKFPEIAVSVDTTKPAVAKKCLDLGAHIINDVSGLKDSGPLMAELAADYGAGLVLMHRRGNPRTMMDQTNYGDLMAEILKELSAAVSLAITSGVIKDQIVIDPGMGFAKNAEQCLEVLKNLEQLHQIGRPVLLGASRKSFLKALSGDSLKDRDAGTAAVSTFAVLKGIQILRVHDVALSKNAARVAEAIRGEDYVRTFKMGND